MQGVRAGIAAERLVLVGLETATAGDEVRHAAFLRNVVAQLQGVPSIAAVTAVNGTPFSVAGWDVPRFTADGQTAEQGSDESSRSTSRPSYPNYWVRWACRSRGGARLPCGPAWCGGSGGHRRGRAADTWPNEESERQAREDR